MPGKTGRRRAEAIRPTAGRTQPLAWLLLVIAIAGCSSLARSPGPSNAEVDELKQRVVELQRKTTVSEVELARLRQEITQLEEELAAKEEAARRQQEQAAAEAAEVPIDLGGEIEEGDVEEELLDEPPMDRSPPEVPPASAPPPAAAAAARPAAPAPAAVVTPQAQALYDESYTLFHEKRYAEAEEGFRRYLELYPTTELADNSQFWIGECRYARGDFNAALAAFTATVERFPGGNKVPDALLKAGKCLEALGDRERAAQTYREVMNRFRGSAAAAAATERLEALR